MNDNGLMTQTLKVEQRFLRWSLHTVLMIHELLSRHELEWMADVPSFYGTFNTFSWSILCV